MSRIHDSSVKYHHALSLLPGRPRPAAAARQKLTQWELSGVQSIRDAVISSWNKLFCVSLWCPKRRSPVIKHIAAAAGHKSWPARPGWSRVSDSVQKLPYRTCVHRARRTHALYKLYVFYYYYYYYYFYFILFFIFLEREREERESNYLEQCNRLN